MKTMDSKILALYLGCEMRTYSGRGKLQSIDMDGHWFVKLNEGGGTVGNINDDYTPYPENTIAFPKGLPPKSILQPVLRPLSSMTEEEMVELQKVRIIKIDGGDQSNAYYISITKTQLLSHVGMNFKPEQFQYLLSKGFDLFNLIESGQAIDSTNP